MLLTPWPVYELCKTLLRFILSQRDVMWPVDAPASPVASPGHGAAAGDGRKQLGESSLPLFAGGVFGLGGSCDGTL